MEFFDVESCVRNVKRPSGKLIYYASKQLFYFLPIAQPLCRFEGCSTTDHSPSDFLGNSARDLVKLLSRPVAAIAILSHLSVIYLGHVCSFYCASKFLIYMFYRAEKCFPSDRRTRDFLNYLRVRERLSFSFKSSSCI